MMWICPSCGAMIGENYINCPNCNGNIQELIKKEKEALNSKIVSRQELLNIIRHLNLKTKYLDSKLEDIEQRLQKSVHLIQHINNITTEFLLNVIEVKSN